MKQELGSRWRTAAKQMRQWAVPPRRGEVQPAERAVQNGTRRETMRSARKNDMLPLDETVKKQIH